MKRFLGMLLALCLLAVPLCSLAEFAFVQLGATTYSEPSEDSQPVSSYVAGTWLEIIEDGGGEDTDEDFVLVEGTDGRQGYASTGDVFVQSSVSAADTAVVANKGKFVNLRQSDSKKAAVIAKVNSGTPMLLMQRGAEYDQVRLGTLVGYMASSMVATDGRAIYAAYAISANGKSINMRSEPTTNGDVLASVPYGSQINVFISGGGWSEIEYKGQRGYMMSKFVSLQGGPEPVPTYVPNPNPDDFTDVNLTMYVSNRGGTVRYRTGPSTKASVAGKCRTGDEVFVYATNGAWCKISIGYGGDTYYMMSKYLVSIMPDPEPEPTYGPIPDPDPDPDPYDE